MSELSTKVKFEQNWAQLQTGKDLEKLAVASTR